MWKALKKKWSPLSRLRKCYFVLAVLSFLCAFVPMLYGIFNIGVWLLYGIALALGVLGATWQRVRRRKWLRRLTAWALAAGLAFFTVTSGLMAYQAFFHRPPKEGELVLVVLGAKVNGGEPSRVLRNRLNTAAKYLLANPGATCVVSGGQGPDEDYPEAVVMASSLESKGVDASRITRESLSTNTRENMDYSSMYIAPGSQVVIVTDSFHQLRASIFARGAGLEPPYGLSSFTPPGLLPCYWIRDLFGVPVAWLQTTLLR